MTEDGMKALGWTIAPNIRHESGEPTYVKKDEHGFTTFATKKMIIEFQSLKDKQPKQ